VQYYRLDPPDTTTEVLLNRIRSFIVSGVPSIFGFTIYDSIEQTTSNGKIPFPSNNEKVLGGHAVMAVGYDDNLVIENKYSKNKTVVHYLYVIPGERIGVKKDMDGYLMNIFLKN